MKKVITILATMIVLVGAVFAANDTLTITANVPKVAPVFVIKGQLTGTGETDTSQHTADATLNSVLDISQTSIPVLITIAQNNTNNNNKSKYQGTATITITPTELSKKIGDTTYKTDLPSYGSGSLKNVSGIESASNGSSIACNDTTKEVTVTLKYKGSSVQNADVASFIYTWGANDNLPPANGYTATITMGYSAP